MHCVAVQNEMLFGAVSGRDALDMGSLRTELQLPHHFITGEDDNDLDEDIMLLGSTPQVQPGLCSWHAHIHVCSCL